MSERIKVFNDTKFDVGLRDIRGIEYNIKPGSFGLFEKTDIEYFVTIARGLFDEPHCLRVEDVDTRIDCGLATEAPSPIDENVIRKNLQQSVQKVKKYIDSIEDPYLLDTVCDVAIAMDLPNSKVAIFREKLPEKFDE